MTTVGLILTEELSLNEIISYIKDLYKDKKFIINPLSQPSLDSFNTPWECHIIKNDSPNWENKGIYMINRNDIINTVNYYIIIYKYSDDIIYYERKGGIKIFEESIETKLIYKSDLVHDKTKTNIENINNYIISYFEQLNTTYLKDLVETLNKNGLDNTSKLLNNYNFNQENKEYYIKLYEDLINNKILNKTQGLSTYYKIKCLDKNKKNSETIYNKLIAESNPKYVLLDRKFIDDCEIADIYDKENNLLFHNKKNDEVRILAFQIIIGVLVLLDYENTKVKKYISKNNINIKNFKYVFGLIKVKDSISSQPQKLAIGFACEMLQKNNIEYMVDFIEYDEN